MLIHRRRTGLIAASAGSISLIDADAINSNSTIDVTNAIGDYILLIDGRTGNNDSGVVSGFSFLDQEQSNQGSSDCSFRMFGRVATGTDETVPVNSGTIHTRNVLVFRGADGSTPIRDSTINTGAGASSPIVIPALASGDVGRAVVGFVCRGANSTLTLDDLTERCATNNGSAVNRLVSGDSGDTLIASLASDSITMATSSRWCAWSLMLNPA